MEKFKQNYQIFIILMSIAWYVLTFPTIKPMNITIQILKKIDTITFPDYEKWYKENKAVWNSIDYRKAQFRLQYQDENNVHLYIRRTQDPTVMKPKLMLILERMNKIYTKNRNRINESIGWIHYFYHPKNGWSGSQNITHYRHYYLEIYRLGMSLS